MNYAALILSIFFGDLLIKNRAEHSVKKQKPGKGLRFLRFTDYHNYGAALNTGEKTPKQVRLVSAAFCAAAAFFTFRELLFGSSPRRKLALSMLLGGGLSNLYDRFTKGYVTDYVSFPGARAFLSRIFGKKAGTYISGIVFNISDFFIIAGAVLAVLSAEE